MFAFTLIGCGGGGGGGESTPTQETIKTGKFVDSPVQGLEYFTTSQNGITDSDGAFKYKDGEVVNFKIGGITLGAVEGSSIITPVEIVNADSMRENKVVQLLQFLQSIDSDADPSNGITITTDLRNKAKSSTQNFSADTIDVYSTIQSLGVSTNNYVDSAKAVEHFRSTLNDINKPSNPDEFKIIENIYEDKDRVLEITSSGLINIYKYNTVQECLDNVTSENYGFELDGELLISGDGKYTLKNNSNIGWNHDGTKITSAFHGSISSSI